MASTREHADKAIDALLTTHGRKYPTAADTLREDHEVVLAFYHFPDAHWQSLPPPDRFNL